MVAPLCNAPVSFDVVDISYSFVVLHKRGIEIKIADVSFHFHSHQEKLWDFKGFKQKEIYF